MNIILTSPEKLIIRGEIKESIANGIRRSVNEVPTIAIDEIEIFKNDSALYDEYLGHRIGLVPLRTNSTLSDKSEVTLKLVKKGPGFVYAGDFQGGAEIVYPRMPLTLLEKDQEVEIVATARLGKGVDHDKYTPGLCYYRHILEITAKNPQIDALVQRSKGLIQPEKKKDVWICDLNESVVDEIEKISKGSVKESNEIVFIIESFGQMDAKEIFTRALRALGENAEGFEKALS